MTCYDDAASVVPQSWNEYAYANNNPLSLIDSLGLDPCPAVSKNSNPKSKDDEDSGEFGPYEPQGGSEAEEQQAAANGNCTSLDGVDLPSGLFGDLGGVGGGWGGGGPMGASPLVSSGGQPYQVVTNPYGGYCYQGQVGQYICAASSYQGELGLADPNLIEAQISNLNATLARSTAPVSAGPSAGTSAATGFGSLVWGDVKSATWHVGHLYCGSNAGSRILKSMALSGSIGAVAGGITGFIGGEALGGLVTFGMSGPAGAALGATMGGIVGAMQGPSTAA